MRALLADPVALVVFHYDAAAVAPAAAFLPRWAGALQALPTLSADICRLLPHRRLASSSSFPVNRLLSASPPCA